MPTYRLAYSALRALSVDAELSSLVQRRFTIYHDTVFDKSNPDIPNGADCRTLDNGHKTTTLNLQPTMNDEQLSILHVDYKATTNRMLRVAVNGFMESLGVVLGVMEGLDTDVLKHGDED